jgi:hypothetical protein
MRGRAGRPERRLCICTRAGRAMGLSRWLPTPTTPSWRLSARPSRDWRSRVRHRRTSTRVTPLIASRLSACGGRRRMPCRSIFRRRVRLSWGMPYWIAGSGSRRACSRWADADALLRAPWAERVHRILVEVIFEHDDAQAVSLARAIDEHVARRAARGCGTATRVPTGRSSTPGSLPAGMCASASRTRCLIATAHVRPQTPNRSLRSSRGCPGRRSPGGVTGRAKPLLQCRHSSARVQTAAWGQDHNFHWFRRQVEHRKG